MLRFIETKKLTVDAGYYDDLIYRHGFVYPALFLLENKMSGKERNQYYQRIENQLKKYEKWLSKKHCSLVMIRKDATVLYLKQKIKRWIKKG